jgi:hypothetical protein
MMRVSLILILILKLNPNLTFLVVGTYILDLLSRNSAGRRRRSSRVILKPMTILHDLSILPADRMRER